MESSPLLLWFDLMGVFFFALSGNILAARKDIDITGPCVISASAAAVFGRPDRGGDDDEVTDTDRGDLGPDVHGRGPGGSGSDDSGSDHGDPRR